MYLSITLHRYDKLSSTKTSTNVLTNKMSVAMYNNW